MNRDGCLHVAAWEPRSIANGPGERFVLWLQGCPFRCAGCVNEAFQPFRPALAWAVEETVERVLAVPGLEGLTLSGGEPMAQAQPLTDLCREVRAAGLTVVCYTGYTLAQLRSQGHRTAAFLAQVDLLIDGLYVQGLPARQWRGSSNQRLWPLSETYRELAAAEDGNPQTSQELIIGGDGWRLTGVLDLELFDRLTANLAGEAPLARKSAR